MTHLLAMLACGALLLRVGFGWYFAGLTRSKNAAATALRNAIDLAIGSLSFWAIGAAILNYQGEAIFGIRPGLIFDAKSEYGDVTFMQLVLVLIGTAPVVGAMSERCKFFPLLASPIVLGGLVIPLAGQWAWNGWLRER